MNDVIDKSKIDLKAELKLEDKPHPEERWEGPLHFNGDQPSDAMTVHVVAHLSLGAGLIEGSGRMSIEGHHVIDMTISGTVMETRMTFEMWLDSSTSEHGRSGNMPAFRGRMQCSGVLSPAGDVLSGEFSHACLQTDTCPTDCTGGKGTFELSKIVEPA